MANDASSHTDQVEDIGNPVVAVEVPISESLKFLIQSIKTVIPLTPDNHPIWSTQLLRLFQANGFEHHLDKNYPIPPKYIPTTHDPITLLPNPAFRSWQMQDHNISAALFSTITTPLLNYIVELESVADIWRSLKLRLQATSRSRVMQLRNELHHLSMKDRPMNQYLADVKVIADLLASAESPLTHEDIILYTLNGLPASYHSFKTAIRTRSTPIPLEEFYNLLCSEEIHLASETQTSLTTQMMAMSVTKNKRTYNNSRLTHNNNRNRRPGGQFRGRPLTSANTT